MQQETRTKTQPSCKVASCGLRSKSYPQHTVEPIFTKNATRNFCCISVFLQCMCNPIDGFFFLFFIILYIIYQYIYIYNNTYTIYRYTSTRTDTKQKTHTHKSCGLRFGTKSCPQHTVGPISGATRNPQLCNFG